DELNLLLARSTAVNCSSACAESTSTLIFGSTEPSFRAAASAAASFASQSDVSSFSLPTIEPAVVGPSPAIGNPPTRVYNSWHAKQDRRRGGNNRCGARRNRCYRRVREPLPGRPKLRVRVLTDRHRRVLAQRHLCDNTVQRRHSRTGIRRVDAHHRWRHAPYRIGARV